MVHISAKMEQRYFKHKCSLPDTLIKNKSSPNPPLESTLRHSEPIQSSTKQETAHQ